MDPWTVFNILPWVVSFMAGIIPFIWHWIKTGRGKEREDTSKECFIDPLILMRVQTLIGNEWKTLGRVLGIEEGKLDQLEIDNIHNVKEAISKMLITWKNQNGQNVTVSMLVQNLQLIGRSDIADQISAMSSMKNIVNNPTVSNEPRLSLSNGSLTLQTLQTLQANLRRMYKTFTMKGLPWMENTKLSWKKHFVQMELSNTKKHVEDQFTNMDFNVFSLRQLAARFIRLFRRIASVCYWTKQTRQKLRLDQIFESTSRKGKRTTRILVEGDPGFGKTTLATKLCYDYRKQKKYLKRFDLVLFFSMKNFSGNVEEMLFRTVGVSGEAAQSQFLEIINNKSVQTLLILDGYDEVPKKSIEAIGSLIHDEEFENITLVVTSRPGMFSSKANALKKQHQNVAEDVGVDIAQVWDKHIKLTGITKARQPEFIDKHLLNFSTDEKLCIKKKIDQMLINNLLTQELLKCPLFILMIISVLTKETLSMQHIKTRTGLYKNIMNYLIRRYLMKIQDPSASSACLFNFENDQKPFYFDLMMQFGAFSLSAINDNKLSFSREYILGLNSNRDKRILELGILTLTTSSLKGFVEDKYYEPVHKSLLEFAAAFFLCNEFRTRSSDQWKKDICNIRPTWASFQSSLIFPFLVGLLGNEALELLNVLKPYAAEYSSHFNCLLPSLCEAEVDDSVLTALNPFLPMRWETDWSNSGSSVAIQPYSIMLEGLKVKRIEQIVWDFDLPVRFLDNVNVDTLLLYAFKKMPPLSKSQFKKFRCSTLVCAFDRVKYYGNEWQDVVAFIKSLFVNRSKDFLCLFPVIQFERIVFVFDYSTITTFLPLVYTAATDGALKDADISSISCELRGEVDSMLDLLIDLIRKDKVKGVCIILAFIPSTQQLANLLTSAAKSPQLKQFILINEADPSLIVDLAQLCNGGQKAYEQLRIENVTMDWKHEVDIQNFQIELFEIHKVNVLASVSSGLQQCKIASFRGCSSILTKFHYHVLHESLLELNIIITEDCVQQELSDCLGRFSNLQVLTLTMTSFKYKDVPAEKWLVPSLEHLPYLKRVEIDEVEKNVGLAKDVVGSIANYLMKNTAVHSSMCQTPSSPHLASVSDPKECQLRYFRLNCNVNPDSSNPSLADASNVSEFVSLVSCLKESLVQKTLGQLDIVVLNLSFLEYMSKFKPNGFASFVEMFPPESAFVVSHDYVGMSHDDSIQSKKWFDGKFVLLHRFSASITKSY